MKQALQEIFGDIDFDKPVNIKELAHGFETQHSECDANLERLVRFIPGFLFFKWQIGPFKRAQEIANINSMLYLQNTKSAPHLTRSIIRIRPYIFLNFLVKHLQPENSASFDPDDISSDNFIQTLLYYLDEKPPLEFDDHGLFFGKICSTITAIVASISNEAQFRRYQNLICFICNFHPNGDKILEFLINQINYQHPTNPALLQNIIANLQKQQILIKSGGETRVKILNDKCQNMLQEKTLESEFAAISPEEMSLIKIIKIFKLYGARENYEMTNLFLHNTPKAGEYLKQKILKGFDETEFYLLTEELLKKDGNFLSLFVKYVDKNHLDIFCESIKTNTNLEGRDKIIESIKKHEHYQSKTQKGRIKKILKVRDEDLEKNQSSVLNIILKDTEKTTQEKLINKFFFYALLSDIDFTAQRLLVGNLLEIENLQDKPEDLVLTCVYFFIQFQISLLDLLDDVNKDKKEWAESILIKFLSKTDIQKTTLETLRYNQELPNLSDKIKKIYQKMILKFQDGNIGDSFIVETLRHICFIEKFSLGGEDEFRFFLKKAFEKLSIQSVKDLITKLRDTSTTVDSFEFKLAGSYKKVLAEALEEYNLYLNTDYKQDQQGILKVIKITKMLVKDEEKFAPQTLIDLEKNKVTSFFSLIDFQNKSFPIILSEMTKSYDILVFFLWKQSPEKVKNLILFLNDNHNNQTPSLLVKIIDYYKTIGSLMMAGEINELISSDLKQKISLLKEQSSTQLLLELPTAEAREAELKKTIKFLEFQIEAQAIEFGGQLSTSQFTAQLSTQKFAEELIIKDTELDRVKAELESAKLISEEDISRLTKELKKTQTELEKLRRKDQNIKKAQQELELTNGKSIALQTKLDESLAKQEALESQNKDLESCV